jgi:hypothetical protein
LVVEIGRVKMDAVAFVRHRHDRVVPALVRHISAGKLTR